nr:hypothetical protein [Tanacetum cinerariifolium]
MGRLAGCGDGIVGVEWRCGSDGSGDGDIGGGSGVTRWWWRVGESGVEDRVDRGTRNLFGFAGKIPPEKISGGCRMVAAVAGRLERGVVVEERVKAAAAADVVPATVAAAAAAAAAAGGSGAVAKWWFAAVVVVAARDIVDRVDRVIRILFGFAGKSPPENFFGGGVVVAGGGVGGRPEVAAGLGERI